MTYEGWDIYDFRREGNDNRRLPINDYRAEYRAFVAGSVVLVYSFGIIAYRVTEPKILGQQLAAAMPLGQVRYGLLVGANISRV